MIKLLVMDVDGTLTDGGIYIGENGEIMKCFNCKDGYAICNILPLLDIKPAIITGRNSTILKRRCEELHIDKLVQNCKDKVTALKKLISEEGVLLEEVAYIGDDLNDYDVMKIVGVRGCPADAVKEIKLISDYVCQTEGGRGAVREFVEWIRDHKN